MASIDEILQPSLFGFRNIKPRGRRERLALNDKTATEKLRLEQRVGIEARLHRANAPETSAGLTSCSTTGAGYISNADRFHTDTAGEEREVRQELLARKQNVIEIHRQQTLSRQDEKQKYIDIKKQKEEEHASWLQNQSSSILKNSSGASYNITNMSYLQTPAGIEQQKIDEMVKYRAQLRARNLVINADTRAPYNILSGESREPPPLPPSMNSNMPPYATHAVQATPWSEWEKRGQQPRSARSRGPY